MTRIDTEFSSQGTRCSAWYYTPDSSSNRPVIVMAHGIGAIREMGLDDYADRFCEAGYCCLVFDYRHLGSSDGWPRQLVDIGRQLQDWSAAIDFARTLSGVDPERVALWGTSFSGGHVIRTAAHRTDIAAVISQSPFTDGPASSWPPNLGNSMRLMPKIVADVLAGRRGREPVTVATTGEPGAVAFITAPGAKDRYLDMAPAGSPFRNEVAARLAIDVPRYIPGRSARHVRCPIMFCVCEYDEVAPPKAAVRHARKAPRSEIVLYPGGHFDIYTGEIFDRAVENQLAFLHRHVAIH